MKTTLLFLLCAYVAALNEDRYETLQVVPQVSGLRVESLAGAPGFIGYTEAWELIVTPDTEVTVVIFGYWLDKVEYVTFTDSVCKTSEFNISSNNFHVQTEARIEFKFSFPEWDRPWRLCVKQKGRFGELLQIDDDRTWITTETVTKEYYLPLPIQIVVLSVLFSMSALFSGLNLGLMSLSKQELNLIIKCGTKREAKYAKAILPIRSKGNYLLCTILIMNVVVNASISILFEDLTSGAIAFVTSSLGIVVLGEIVPQSACVKHGLAVGAKTLFLTKFFMFITYPLSMPISKLLDCLLGEEVDQFNRSRLVEMMKMSTENENNDLAAELKIAVGAMEYVKKSAKDVMTRIDDVFMLPEEEILNATIIADIVKRGYARIPVYRNQDRNQVHRNNRFGNALFPVVSLLFARDLALIDKKNNIPVKAVSEFNDRELRIVDENTNLGLLLEEFKAGNYHLALVKKSTAHKAEVESEMLMMSPMKPLLYRQMSTIKDCSEEEEDDEPPQLVGLITLEDILEEILQAEIIDESDSVLDNVQRYKRKMSESRLVEMFCCESRSDPLPLNMLRVVCNFLKEHHVIFDDRNLHPRARERMIQKNIRQAILVARREDGSKRMVKLYEIDVPSKRAILILEGKAKIRFKKSGQEFEVGPWSFLGDVLLNKVMYTMKSHNELHSGMYFKPDFELVVEQPCKFLQISLQVLMHALRLSHVVKQLKTSSMSDLSSTNDEEGIPLLLAKRAKSSFARPRHKSTLTVPSQQETRFRSISTVSAVYRSRDVDDENKLSEEISTTSENNDNNGDSQ